MQLIASGSFPLINSTLLKALFHPYNNCPLLPLKSLPPAPSSFNLISSNLQRDDFLAVLSSRRNASSPGFNMIPYKVYKKYLRILSFLFKIFQSYIARSLVPTQWRDFYSQDQSSRFIKDLGSQCFNSLNLEKRLFQSSQNTIFQSKKIDQFVNSKGILGKGAWLLGTYVFMNICLGGTQGY